MEEMQLLPEISDYELTNTNAVLSRVGGLISTPENYGKAIYSDDDESLEKGKWYFNYVENYLIYVISNRELFTSDLEGLPRIRFRIALDYNDRNLNGLYEPAIDEFRSMKLNAIDQYQWN